MPRVHYHLHVNHFGATLPRAIAALVSSNRFLAKPCQIINDSGSYPLWIVTRKFHSHDDAAAAFQSAFSQIVENGGMNGYLECEEVVPGSVQKFVQLDYKPSMPFPVPRGGLQAGPRRGDIHVFRAGQTARDELDNRLASAGFYEVTTAEERIWTLLFEDVTAAEEYYVQLCTHFLKAGGISKIENEKVDQLSSIPDDFLLLPVISVPQKGT